MAVKASINKQASWDKSTSNLTRYNDPSYANYTFATATTGASDWIIVEDSAKVSVLLSFDAAGTATVEATNFPIETINGTVSSPTPVAVAVIASTSTASFALLEGYTAVRLNVSSGTPRLTVHSCL